MNGNFFSYIVLSTTPLLRTYAIGSVNFELSYRNNRHISFISFDGPC